MASKNPFVQIADRYGDLPGRLRRPLVTRAIGQTIPFVEAVECFVEAYTSRRVAVRLDSRPDVENHLGGLHASALGLLAETATGLVVALNVPDGSTPLLREMNVSFERFARNAAIAEATLTDDQGSTIQSRAMGQLGVDVTLTAPADDTTLVSGSLKWAWVPEERVQSST